MVEHRPAEHRFVEPPAEGEAVLSYALPAAGVIDLQHTRVPESGRGHGAADALARAAFAYARQQRLKVIPTCPYVRAWLTRHPEERDIVAAASTPG
jgi:uncharacterized protein